MNKGTNIDEMLEKKENLEKDNVNIDSTNIFDEFAGDENMKEEVERMKIEKEKDSYYYLTITSKVFKIFNTILFLLLIIVGLYIYVQKDDNFKYGNYLEPVCFLMVNGNTNSSRCSSVSKLLKDVNANIEKKSEMYYNANLGLVEDIYTVSNFLFSRDVSFLTDKTSNKIKPLEILEEFDKLQTDFGKTKVKCFDIEIDGDYNVEMNCSSYSGEWDTKILGYSGKDNIKNKVPGTSVSVASSFINFIEKRQNTNFLLIDKPKKFNFREIVDIKGYTKQTDFKLKFMFKNNNIGLQKK